MKNKVTFFFRLLTCLTSNGLTVGMFGHTPGLVTCPYVTDEKYRGITKRTATERSIVRKYRYKLRSKPCSGQYIHVYTMHVHRGPGGRNNIWPVSNLIYQYDEPINCSFSFNLFWGELLYGNLTKNMKKGWKKNLKHLMQQIQVLHVFCFCFFFFT